MPELPEVETTRRGIAPWVENAKLDKVVVRDSRLRWPVVVEELKSLEGDHVTSLERRAKYLLFRFASGATLLMHLGMSGSMRVLEPQEPARKHDHIDLVVSLDSKPQRIIRFNDPRRFGCCLLLPEPAQEHPLLSNLGPEPLTN